MASTCSTLDRLSPNTRKRFFEGLLSVLKNKCGRDLYKQFLCEYYEEENNLIFWEMCSDLVEHYEAKDTDTRVAAARKILSYAADLANMINVDEAQLRQLKHTIHQPGKDDVLLLKTLHDFRNTAFDWLEERYFAFLEWSSSDHVL